MTGLFVPGKIGSLELKNLLVRSATWEALAGESGFVTNKLIDYTLARVRGGVGFHIMGITAVAPEGLGMPGMSAIYSDAHVDGHARLTEAVHRQGGKVCLQIAHVGGQTHPAALPAGREPVGPSALVHPSFNNQVRALATGEVKAIIDAFGQAAARAARAGYDAAQIHGAHGYLVDQFLSPLFNRRDDEYGEPARFLLDVFKAVKSAAGKMPVTVKLSLHDFREGSTTPEIALPAAKALDALGIDAIEVSGGMIASGDKNPSRTRIDSRDKEAYLLSLAKMVKAQVSCPVISVGGYRSLEVINRALETGEADFIAVSRPLIREPDLPNRWQAGDTAPARCISCNRCFGTVKYGEGIQCKIDLKERLKKE